MFGWFRHEEDALTARIAAVALLDSGATHAVIPYHPTLQDLDSVPVTLAGDAKDHWWKTRGGTLVVPPPGASKTKEIQTILPFGALVEVLGCKVSWSKRSGLTVIHPRLGKLKTGISRNTCPYVQEDQALALISELEERKLAQFEDEVETFQCHLENLEKPLDPTETLRVFARTGTRQDALRAVMAQPYFAGAREDIKARLAEALPGFDEVSGKEVLKGLPLNRSSRRELLGSTRWVVHLCSGEKKPNDPLVSWSQEHSAQLLNVDVTLKGGKGWDLGQHYGAWRALLWGAATGRIIAILASPPPVNDETKLVLNLQPMFLWSLASVTRGKGIPFFLEHALVEDRVPNTFAAWSGSLCKRIGRDPNPLKIISNIDLGFVDDLLFEGRKWTKDLREVLARALSGRPRCQSLEVLDSKVAKGVRALSAHICPSGTQAGLEEDEEEESLTRMFEQESMITSSDEEKDWEQVTDLVEGQNPSIKASPSVSEVKEMSPATVDAWKRHLLNGHTPYRRDCRFCVEGSGLGVFHNRVRHPRSYALSIDLFGPVPASEAGRDETCVTGKCNLRYGLVGAFKIPKALLDKAPKADGVTDLFASGDPESQPLPLDAACDEYEPSETRW